MEVSQEITVSLRKIAPKLVAAVSVAAWLGGEAPVAAQTFIERNLTENTHSHGAGEPQIAVNPKNPKNIVYVSTFYKYVQGWVPTVNPNGSPDYEGPISADLTSAVTFAGGPFDYL